MPRELSLTEKQQLRDELRRARQMAAHMDTVLAAFDRITTHEIDATCPLCGGREIRHTRDAKAPGAVMAVCNKCLSA